MSLFHRECEKGTCLIVSEACKEILLIITILKRSIRIIIKTPKSSTAAKTAAKCEAYSENAFLSNDRLSTVCIWRQVSEEKKEGEEKDGEAGHSSSVIVKAPQRIPFDQQSLTVIVSKQS